MLITLLWLLLRHPKGDTVAVLKSLSGVSIDDEIEKSNDRHQVTQCILCQSIYS